MIYAWYTIWAGIGLAVWLSWGRKKHNSTVLHLGSNDFMPLNYFLFHLFWLLFCPSFSVFLFIPLFWHYRCLLSILNMVLVVSAIFVWSGFIDIVRVRLSISFDKAIANKLQIKHFHLPLSSILFYFCHSFNPKIISNGNGNAFVLCDLKFSCSGCCNWNEIQTTFDLTKKQ